MRTFASTLLLIAVCDAAFATDEPPPFQLIRADEDYSPAATAGRYGPPPEPYKYLPLGADAETYLSFGGEIRERYDALNAPRFGIRSSSENYELQRLLVHADFHWGRRFRIFAQLGKHDVYGKQPGQVLPVDESRLNIQNLFIDLVPDESGHWLLRVGRQEMVLSPTQRFISVREGPNFRQSYDGGRFTWQTSPWKIEVFSLRPVIVVKPGTFENKGGPNTLFSGLRVSHSLADPEDVIEAYWLSYDHWGAHYGPFVGDERRRMAGIRVALHNGPWDMDAEFVWQYGTFMNRDIRAWGVGADGGYTFAVTMNPRLGLRFDGASGGSASDPSTIETFNPLFPKGFYFDESTLTTYANLLSVRPSLTVTPSRTLSVQVSEAWRWKEDVHDALYLTPFVPIPGTAVTPGKYVGRWTVVDGTWHTNRWLSFQAEYVHVNAGAAVQSAGGHDVNFTMAIAQLKF